MFKSKKLSSLALATAILLGAVTPAFADTGVVAPTPVNDTSKITNTSTNANTTYDSQIGDVKTVVKNGKVVTTIKYADGTETEIVTALPSVVSSNSSSTTTLVKKDPQYNTPITFKEKAFTADTTASLNSNDDTTRRGALQKATGATLLDSEVWNNDDKKGTDWLGREVTYTPVSEMKSQGIYSANANRQELITYGIRTKDWQPYYQLEYQRTPLYFTLKSDGTLEYSKIYWSRHMGTEVTSYRENLTSFHQGQLSLTKSLADIEADHRKAMEGYIANWKAASGPVVSVIGFNNREDYAKVWGVDVVPTEFYDSVYNDPSVVRDGKFSDGAKTKSWN